VIRIHQSNRKESAARPVGAVMLPSYSPDIRENAPSAIANAGPVAGGFGRSKPTPRKDFAYPLYDFPAFPLI
jgi:hypothetical protein